MGGTGRRRSIFRRRILAAADCLPGRLAAAGLLVDALKPCTCESDEDLGNDSGLEDKLDNSPGALHCIVAVVLVVALVGGLVRVYRVLQNAETLVPMRHDAPEGMRPVECGGCRTPQYASSHGRVFICFCCHSANRIPVELAGLSVRDQELISPTGPLRIYEFIKGGENFWQETTQEELEEGQETSRAIAERDLPTVIGRRREPTRDLDTESNASGRSGRSDSCLAQCVVCLDAPGTMVLLPCAHGSVCEECTTRIVQNRASGGAHCPHCRSNIKTLVKITELDGTKAKGIEFRIPMARSL